MRPMISLILSIFLGVLAVNKGWIGDNFKAKIDVSIEERFVSVEDGEYYIEYNILNEMPKQSYRVVHFNHGERDMSKLGISNSLAVLEPKDYADFIRLTSAGQCPANFLNQHAHVLLIVPSSPDVRSQINSLSLNSGDPINVLGQRLAFDYGEVNNQKMDSFNFGGAIPILVRDIKKL